MTTQSVQLLSGSASLAWMNVIFSRSKNGEMERCAWSGCNEEGISSGGGRGIGAVASFGAVGTIGGGTAEGSTNQGRGAVGGGVEGGSEEDRGE